MNYNNKQTGNPLTFGLSMIAGTGVTLMIIAGGVGVLQGDDANTGAIGVLFAAGLLLLIAGSIAWFGVVQPHKHFDDINQPLEDDHAHGHAHDSAIVPVEGEAGAVVTVERDAHGHPITVVQH